ncbi:MAG: serine kinase [Thermodesulfobacteriota bacterium]
MNTQELADRFGLAVAAGSGGLDRQIRGGYCGDLLSEVMANAPIGCVWLTIQVHQNIVAVAVLREMAAIVLTGGNTPAAETREKADRENIPILESSAGAYDLAGRFYAAGIVNQSADGT